MSLSGRLDHLTDSVVWNGTLAAGFAGLPLAAFGAWLVAALAIRPRDPQLAQTLLLVAPLVLAGAFAAARRLYPPRGVVIPMTDALFRRLMQGLAFVFLYPLITALLVFSAFEDVTALGVAGVAGVVALAAAAPWLVRGFVDGALVVGLTTAIVPFLATHPGDTPEMLAAKGLHPATLPFDEPWMTVMLVGLGTVFAAYGVCSHLVYAWDGRRRVGVGEEGT